MRLSSSAPFTPPTATQVVKSNTQRSGTAPLSGWLQGVPTISSRLEDRLSSQFLSWLGIQIKQLLKID
jgi:hypothetical protein